MSATRAKSSGWKWLCTGSYPCQYVTRDSPVHRLGAGWKIAVCTILSVFAIGARSPGGLLALVVVTLAYYFAARLTVYDLWRDIRFFVFQGAIVISLYCLLNGVNLGLWPGVRTSVQIILFYIPGAVFLRTTRTGEMMRGLRKIVPYRLAFLVFVSIRFVPFFLRELQEITAAQRLRGARLLPRQLLNPRNWRDLFNCLFVPLMVRALKIADDVSLAAEAREFGVRKERTFLDISSRPATDGMATTTARFPAHTVAIAPCSFRKAEKKKGIS